MMLAPVDAVGARDDAQKDDIREKRWIDLYTALTGASESAARCCWMYAPEPPHPAEPAPITNGETSYDFQS